MLKNVLQFAMLKLRELGLPGSAVAFVLTLSLCLGSASMVDASALDPNELLDRFILPFVEVMVSVFAVLLVAHSVRGELNSGRYRLWSVHGGQRSWWLGVTIGCWLAVGLWLFTALAVFIFSRPYIQPVAESGEKLRSLDLMTRVADRGLVFSPRVPAAATSLGAPALGGRYFVVPQQDYLGPGETLKLHLKPRENSKRHALRILARHVSIQHTQFKSGSQSRLKSSQFPVVVIFETPGGTFTERLLLQDDQLNYIPLPLAPTGDKIWIVTLKNPSSESFLVFENRDALAGLRNLRGLELVIAKGDLSWLIWLAGFFLWLKLGVMMTLAASLALFVRSETAAILVIIVGIVGFAAPSLERQLRQQSQTLSVAQLNRTRTSSQVVAVRALSKFTQRIPAPLKFDASRVVQSRVLPLRSFLWNLFQQALGLTSLILILGAISIHWLEDD